MFVFSVLKCNAVLPLAATVLHVSDLPWTQIDILLTSRRNLRHFLLAKDVEKVLVLDMVAAV